MSGNDRAAVCEDGKITRHAHDQLWQTVLTVFIHLETTVGGCEVDVGEGCPDEERRAGRRGCRVRGKWTRHDRTLD